MRLSRPGNLYFLVVPLKQHGQHFTCHTYLPILKFTTIILKSHVRFIPLNFVKLASEFSSSLFGNVEKYSSPDLVNFSIYK